MFERMCWLLRVADWDHNYGFIYFCAIHSRLAILKSIDNAFVYAHVSFMLLNGQCPSQQLYGDVFKPSVH